MSRPVWLDRGPASVLACCADCRPLWRVAAADDADGWRQLAAHIAAVHPAVNQNVAQSVRRGLGRARKSDCPLS